MLKAYKFMLLLLIAGTQQLAGTNPESTTGVSTGNQVKVDGKFPNPKDGTNRTQHSPSPATEAPSSNATANVDGKLPNPKDGTNRTQHSQSPATEASSSNATANNAPVGSPFGQELSETSTERQTPALTTKEDESVTAQQTTEGNEKQSVSSDDTTSTQGSPTTHQLISGNETKQLSILSSQQTNSSIASTTAQHWNKSAKTASNIPFTETSKVPFNNTTSIPAMMSSAQTQTTNLSNVGSATSASTQQPKESSSETSKEIDAEESSSETTKEMLVLETTTGSNESGDSPMKTGLPIIALTVTGVVCIVLVVALLVYKYIRSNRSGSQIFEVEMQNTTM